MIDSNPDALEAGRAAYVRALILARCPELSERDLALLADAPSDLDAGIPVNIADQIMDVLLAFEERLDRIERAVRAPV
jgi:hypothetical protein